ncbi:hypothetical protein P7C71_g3792, partial [Lecanoromycetidae sp. Uapishka_2]
MVSRKSHPKSRNGCANCKKRRIKHSPKTASTSSSSPRATRHRSSASEFARSTIESPNDHSPALQRSPLEGPGAQLPALHMEDLELLHHFTTETCYTLSDRPESHELWRVNALQVAFQHPFLMRGILAISALHLSCLRPDKQNHYAQIAIKQQDAALGSFRAIMSNMDQSNCDAFFALSSLIVVYGFESPKNSDSLGMFNCNGQDSDDWLPLIRGVNSVLQNVWPWIKNGRLRGLIHDHQQQQPQKGLPSVLEEQLAQLEKLCESSADGHDAIEAYQQALMFLRMCFVRMNNRPSYECEVSIAFLWPVMIPQEYISMLNMRRPEALIILAHYCVILHHLDDYWWVRGWAMHIIEYIHQELDEDWRYWIQWPTNVITVDEKILTNGTLPNPISGNRVSNDFNTCIDQALDIPNEELKNTA